MMQKTVQEFIEKYDLSCGVQTRYIDFVSETGELGKEILKNTDYGKNSFHSSEPAMEETGDCLFSLLALCCEMNISAEEALRCAMKKYSKRFETKGTIDSDH